MVNNNVCRDKTKFLQIIEQWADQFFTSALGKNNRIAHRISKEVV